MNREQIDATPCNAGTLGELAQRLRDWLYKATHEARSKLYTRNATIEKIEQMLRLTDQKYDTTLDELAQRLKDWALSSPYAKGREDMV